MDDETSLAEEVTIDSNQRGVFDTWSNQLRRFNEILAALLKALVMNRKIVFEVLPVAVDAWHDSGVTLEEAVKQDDLMGPEADIKCLIDLAPTQSSEHLT